MQCCVCQDKPATVHLTQTVEGKMQKLDFCAECAKAQGVDVPSDVLTGCAGSYIRSTNPRFTI